MFTFLKEQVNDFQAKYIEKNETPIVTLAKVRAALADSKRGDSLNGLFFDMVEKNVQSDASGGVSAAGNGNNQGDAFGSKSLMIFQQTRQRMQEEEEQRAEEEKEEKLRKTLNTIDKAYLLDKTKEEELVLMEFKRFPKYAPSEAVEQRESVLLSYNGVISEKLNENCLKQYDNIAKGFELIDQIDRINQQQVHSIAAVRTTMSQAKSHLVTKAKYISSLKKEIIFKQDRFGELNKRIRDLDNEDCLIDAHIVIPKLNAAKLQLLQERETNSEVGCIMKKYTCLNSIDTFITSKIEMFKKYISASAEKVILGCTLSKYCTIMHSYFYLQKHFRHEIKPYSQLFQANIPVYIDNLIKGVFLEVKESAGFYYEESRGGGSTSDRKHLVTRMISHVPTDSFVLFLRTVMHRCCEFMSSYQSCMGFLHQLNNGHNPEFVESLESGAERTDFFGFLEEMSNLFVANSTAYWVEIQNACGLLLHEAQQFQSLQLVGLRELFEYFNIFMGIGESFSNSTSKLLQNFIVDKCEAYVEHFHRTAQVGVISALHGEKWRRLPTNERVRLAHIEKGEVQSSAKISRLIKSYCFKPRDLNEISSTTFEHSLSWFKAENPFGIAQRKQSFDDSGSSVASKSRSASYFRKFNKKYNAGAGLDTNNTNSSCVSNSAVRVEKVSVQIEEYSKDFIVMSTSSTEIFKSMNEYVQLADVLRPVAPSIILAIKANVHYMVYYMVMNFLDSTTQARLQEKLVLSGVTKIDDINSVDSNIARFAVTANNLELQMKHGNLAKLLQDISVLCFETIRKLIPPSQLKHKVIKTVSERIIAIEAFDYVVFVLASLTKFVEKRMYGEHSEEFGMKELELIRDELRNVILVDFAPSFVRCEQIFAGIPNAKWDNSVVAVSSSVSLYAERFCQTLVDIQEQLSSIGGGSIPEEVQDDFFHLMLSYSYRQLCEAFSKIKKINDQGREQLQRDFEAISICVKAISNGKENSKSRNQVQRAYVEDYLKICSSVDIDEISTFISFNRERYSLESLIGLTRITAAGSALTRGKQRDLIVQTLLEYKKFFLENNVTIPF